MQTIVRISQNALNTRAVYKVRRRVGRMNKFVVPTDGRDGCGLIVLGCHGCDCAKTKARKDDRDERKKR